MACSLDLPVVAVVCVRTYSPVPHLFASPNGPTCIALWRHVVVSCTHTARTLLVKNAWAIGVDVPNGGLLEECVEDELVLPGNGVGDDVLCLLNSLVKVLLFAIVCVDRMGACDLTAPAGPCRYVCRYQQYQKCVSRLILKLNKGVACHNHRHSPTTVLYLPRHAVNDGTLCSSQHAAVPLPRAWQGNDPDPAPHGPPPAPPRRPQPCCHPS